MKLNTQKAFQKFIESIEFPTIVYLNETGKIIASNHHASMIIGDKNKNIRELIDNERKVRFHRIIKEKFRTIFHNVIIYQGHNKLEVDVEINPIKLGNEHVMICFFSQSYKMMYDKYLSILVPRLFYKDANLNFEYCSRYFQLDTNIDMATDVVTEDFIDQEVSVYITELEQELIRDKRSDYNSIHTIKSRQGRDYFARMHRMPVQDGNGTVYGLLGVYTVILNRDEFQGLFDATLRENQVLTRIVSRQDRYVVSWRMEQGWPIEYISSNFADFEYELLELHSGLLNWRMLMHSEDYERINQEIEACIESEEDVLPILRYRLRKNSGKYLWVEDTTHSLVWNGQVYLREGMFKVLPEDTYKELEKKYGRGISNEDNDTKIW